jgi:hypothetical protein
MRTRGQVDNRNDAKAKSLSKGRRERELLRITKENLNMFKRINNKKPAISREMHEKEWRKNLKFMDNISAYPEEWYSKEKQQSTSRSSQNLKQQQQMKKSSSEENSSHEANNSSETMNKKESTEKRNNNEKKKEQEAEKKYDEDFD